MLMNVIDGRNVFYEFIIACNKIEYILSFVTDRKSGFKVLIVGVCKNGYKLLILTVFEKVYLLST